MAVLIPSLGSITGRMQAGERRFAERLLQKLEDDYLCWYNVPLGHKQLYPDFVVLHPRRGLLVLEVKDWKLDTIREADRSQFTLLTNRGLTKTANPLEQARQNMLRVVDLLQQDPALRHPPGHAHAGKLAMPYGWGAVLTSITRRQFEQAQLDQVLEPGRVICKDEMLESVDTEAFQTRLWAMFSHVFSVVLSLPQIERVRWHLFPEVRVPSAAGQFGLFERAKDDSPPVDIPDLVRVMDVQQEQLARSLGEGHRVIHGVAGSGKTMILGYRCLHLARLLPKPILVLCYNVTLAARLRQLLGQRGVGRQVSVRGFHEWCSDMLRSFHIERPRNDGSYEAYTAALVKATIDGVEKGHIPRAQYGAVLIDEGHDFEPEWFRLVVQMVDPDTNALLVLYDDAQSIYSNSSRRKFSFASVGIQAQGRSAILRLNYRNTLEILSVAKAFASDLLEPRDSDDDGQPIVAPESAGRRGPLPEIIRCHSFEDEGCLIAERILAERAEGRSLHDIAVLIQNNWQAEAVLSQLKAAAIPFVHAKGWEAKRRLYEGAPAVKVVTLHSSKGLEFGLTFIPRLCALPKAAETAADDARLLYVGMTRATERLVLTHVGSSAFTEKLSGAVFSLQADVMAA